MFGPVVSPKELRESHPKEKRRSDFQNQLWAYLVLRQLSFYAASVFIWFGFTANQVTILGGLILVAGFFSFLVSTEFAIIVVGALLINLWDLLDFADGAIARYNETSSTFGAYLDWLIGMTYHTVLPFCIAVVLYRTTTFEVTASIFPFPAYVWFVLAVIDTIFRLFRRVVIQKGDLLSPGENKNRTTEGNTLKMLVGAPVGFKPPLLLVAAVVGILDLWLLFYTVYSIALFWPALILQFKRVTNK